jgi:aspartate ammonia-lyase
MSLSLSAELEEILEEEGYFELLNACKSIVSIDDSDYSIVKPIDENNMKESMGVSKVYWLKHKIAILDNIDVFEEKCKELELNAENFLKEINDDIKAVELFLNNR